MRRVLAALIVAFAWVPLGATVSSARGPEAEHEPDHDGVVKLTCWVSADGAVLAFFDSRVRSLPADEVGEALAGSLGVDPMPRGDSPPYGHYRARESPRFSARSFERRLRIDPAPVASLCALAGYRTLEIEVNHPGPNLGRNDWASHSLALDRPDVVLPNYHWIRLDLASESPPAAFDVAFGYASHQVDSLLAALAALTIAAAPLAFLFHRRGRIAIAAGQKEAWLAAATRLRVLRYAGWLGLAAVLYALDGAGIASYSDAPDAVGRAAIGIVLTLLAGPGLAVLIGLGVSDLALRASAARLDGQTRLLIRIALLARVLGPIGFLFLAVGVAGDGYYRPAAVAFVLAFATRAAADLALMRFAAISFHEISSGALRDRLAALATKAGVTVRRFTLMAVDRFDFTNAFAVSRDQIFVTNGLLTHLDRREVDAVAAHELTHLRRRHLLGLRLVPILVSTGVAAVVLFACPEASGRGFPLLLVVCVEAGMLAFFATSRRFEFQADAGALELTGDRDAVIGFNAALARLGALPNEWGPVTRLLSTHPSPRRRISALETLATPECAAPSAIGIGSRYEDEASLGAKPRLYSTPLLLKVGRIRRLALVLLAAGIPALASAAAFSTPASSVLPIVFLALGAIVSVALYFMVENVIVARPIAALEERLRVALSPSRSAIFVGLAPDARVRLYDGFHDWDAGFLALEDGSLAFVGERTRFRLRREDVFEIARGPRPAGWFRAPRVVIRRQVGEAGAPLAFSIAPLGESTVRRAGRATEALADRLRAWHASGVPSIAPAEPPVFPEVSSLSPGEFCRARTVAATLFSVAPFAALGPIIVGVPRNAWGVAIPYAVVSAVAVAFLRYVPFRGNRGVDSTTITSPDASRETPEPPR